MAKIIVLGGCGAVGNVAVKTLSSFTDFKEILIGDVNKTRAHEIIAEIGSNNVSFMEINALDENNLRDKIKDFDVVLNCIDPFYKYQIFESHFLNKNWV